MIHNSPFLKGHGNALKYSPHHKNQITQIQFILYYINENASILRELDIIIDNNNRLDG